MELTQQVFDNILIYVENNRGGIVTYTRWKEQYKPKRDKKQSIGISKDVQGYFEEFWMEYPGTSRFEYNGKKFQGERVLKANKQVCLKLYNSVLESMDDPKWDKTETAKITSDILLQALRVQIANIKIESYRTGQNRMQYMKSCEVYLKHKAYESWLGVEMPEDIKNTKPVSVDIDI